MKFYDVTNWSNVVSSTKGTRDKNILINPEDGCDYFVKFPMCRDNRDYSAETWSEIIAYEVGVALGFDVLRYDFALWNDRSACISKNMITDSKEESLVEGDSILTAFDTNYDPENKSMYSQYTVDFVMNALRNYQLAEYIPDFLKMLVFDAIIGNSDRHQSNWGFIKRNIVVTYKKRSIFNIKGELKTRIDKEYAIAPIYDSGCCLGREFGEQQIVDRLKDKNRLNSYINRATAELRIDTNPTKKSPHYELLQYLCGKNSSWKQVILETVDQVYKNYNNTIIPDIVFSIDNPLPENIKLKHGMSNNRKEFVSIIINNRIDKLKYL